MRRKLKINYHELFPNKLLKCPSLSKHGYHLWHWGETSNIVITIGYFEDMKRSCWYISSYIWMHARIICNTKPLSATQINVSNVAVFPYQAIMTMWKSHIIMNEMPDHYHGETLHIISAV